MKLKESKITVLVLAMALASVYAIPAHAEKEFTCNGRTAIIAEAGDIMLDELIVKLNPGVSAKDAAAVAAQLGGKVSGSIDEYNLYLIKLSGKANQKEAVSQALGAAKADARVADAFPNARVSIPNPCLESKSQKQSRGGSDLGLTPEDQGPVGMTSAGTFAAPTGNQWHLNQIHWDYAGTPPTSTGIIAVLDSGVDYTHPDLAGNVILGKDFVDDDMDPMDVYGHGTHVAGIIAAKGAYMVRGVSPNTKILAVRVLDSSGSGTTFNVWQGVIWARSQTGVKAINLSLGGYAIEGSSDYNAGKKVFDDTLAKGVLPVVAAGNDDNYYLYYYQSSTSKYRPVPAWLPSCFTVGASQEVDNRAYFSNYDIGTLDNKTFNYNFVDIVAPGWNILSTVPGFRYERWNGTSMATPVVAGVVARYWAKYPTKTAAQVVAGLQSTGQSVGVYNGFPTAEKRVDLMKALGLNNTGFVGVVYNGQTGVTLSGVTVTAKVGATTKATATTNSEGFFTLKGLTGGTAYTVSYAKTGFSAPGASATATANQLVPFVKPVFMNQSRPAGQWSALIDWRSWHPGYDEAYYTYPSKPSWFPYNWDTTAGTYFSSYVRSSTGYVIEPSDRGSLTTAPYMALTHNAWDTYDRRPGAAFVIKPQGTTTYQVYTHLDNLDPDSDYYEWGKYKTVTNVTDPRIQARLYYGSTLKATVNANSATGTGRYWHIATIKGSNVTVVNKLQATAP